MAFIGVMGESGELGQRKKRDTYACQRTVWLWGTDCLNENEKIKSYFHIKPSKIKNPTHRNLSGCVVTFFFF